MTYAVYNIEEFLGTIEFSTISPEVITPNEALTMYSLWRDKYNIPEYGNILTFKLNVDPKSYNDVMWLSEHTGSKGISYTHEYYKGASEYWYKWKHLPSNKEGCSFIYGLTAENGKLLLECWNRQQPKNWHYSEFQY